MFSSTSKSSTSNKSSVTPDTALKGIAAFGGVLEWTCSASFRSLLTSYNTCAHTFAQNVKNAPTHTLRLINTVTLKKDVRTEHVL